VAPGSGSQQPEEKTFLGFPARPGGDGEAVKIGRHHWYELAQEVHGAFADIELVIGQLHWSGDARRAFDAVWSQFSGHGTEASQHSQEMGDHLLKLGSQIEGAQHEWDLAVGAMAVSTAIGIGLTFLTFGISDAVAEGAATAAVGSMEAICAALDISLDAAMQVLLAAIRIASQLAVKFTWQFSISVVSQEGANVVTGAGLDMVDLIQAAEFAGVSMVVPGLATKVTIGGSKVFEGASGAVLTGALTDTAVQGVEGVTEGKPFNAGEVVVSGALAGAGHLTGEELGARLGKEGPEQEAPTPRGDLRFQLDQDPAQLELAVSKVADWGGRDVTGHTSASHRVTFADGQQGFLKPYTGEDTAGRQYFERGTLWRNEVGVHEVDKALGFKLTATTTAVEAPGGGPLEWDVIPKPSP
jgi:hypothetical protein